MLIGGLQKTTLIDFPEKIAATIFTQGCSFRCSYCHNPELVIPACYQKSLSEETVFDFLKKRVGLLQGVCITGGEPTLQRDLRQFITRVKDMGFSVKLDTNGSNPDHLELIVADGNVDYIAMDVKTSLENYFLLTKSTAASKFVSRSINLIMHSGIDYEFRTTVAQPLHEKNSFEAIGMLINGAKRYFLQNYVKAPKQVHPTDTLKPLTNEQLTQAQVIMQKYVRHVGIR